MLASLKKNSKGILLIILSSLFVCIGQLFWKLSTDGNLIFLIIGFMLYGFGALIMLYAYKFGSLSILQPMLSTNYIFTILLATFVLKEQIDLLKIIGIFIILLGVIFIGGGESCD